MRDILKDPTPQTGDVINDPESPFHGAEITYTFTRAELISVNILTDLTNYARACGIKLPLAMTSTAYSDALCTPHIDRKPSDIDISRFVEWVRRVLMVAPRNENQFTAPFLTIDGRAAVALKIHIGPGDSGEPVLTVMLPNED